MNKVDNRNYHTKYFQERIGDYCRMFGYHLSGRHCGGHGEGGGKKMKDQISNRNKGFFPEGMTQGQKTLMGFTLFFLLVFCYIIARADVQLPALG